MKQKLLTLFFLSLLTVGYAFAQNRTITGTVIGKDDGLPLPGVSVRLKGTTTGVQTNADGKYQLALPAGNGTLTFTYIGYATQEIAAGADNVINVSLVPDSKLLGEVVVTALGVQRAKRALTYSVQSVDPAEVVQSRETNIVNALSGKVAGVSINNSGGQAGSSSRIVIRGNTSLTGNNEPLFVIDGIPVDNSTNRAIGEATESALFNGYGSNRGIDIDPANIENVTVLKGASATAIYGSRGAFGVVLITTKKGEKSSGKFPKISFSSSYAADNAYTTGYQTSYLGGSLGLYKNGLPASAGGYSEAAGGATQSTASWGPHKDSVSAAVIAAVGRPTVLDPRKSFYQTGSVYNNSISLSGGNDKTTYILGYSNVNQEGIVKNNDFKRNSVTASFSSQLTEAFTTSTSVNYINSANKRMPEGNTKRSFLYSLNFAPINFDSKDAYEKFGNLSWSTATGFNNPYWLVNNILMPSSVDRLIASNESSVKILPWLKLTNRIGVDTYTDEQREQVNIGTISIPNGRMYESLIKRAQFNNDLILTADKKISPDITFSGLIGNNINSRNYARRTIRGLNLSIPNFYDITNAETTESLQADSKRRLVGVYSSVTFDYKNYLFLSATARNDWSSTLPTGDNSYFYPSVSAGFVFTDLLGMSGNKYLPYGKVRLSYAQAGNDASEYLTNQTFTQANPGDGRRGNIAFPYNGVNGFQTSDLLANNRLKPEIVTEIEVGTDLRFLNNRLGVDFSYYDKTSESQILQQEISAASGYAVRTANAGEISNKGIELIMTGSPVKTKDFSWNLAVNFGRNKYKLKSIAEGVDNIFLGGFSSPQIRADKNYGYGVIWGQGFKHNAEGKLLIDDDGLPVLADELGPIGNATPKWNAGFRSSMSYKGLTLSGLLDVRKGGDIMNFDLYYSTFYGTSAVTANRNTMYTYDGVNETTGKQNDVKIKRDQAYYQNWYSSIDQNFVEDGSFIKLREVTLSYTLGKKILAKSTFDAVNFSVTGRNLWTKSDFSFGDPEGALLGNTNGQGFYNAVTPGTRGVTFGLNVKF
ncbi:SusC/RagA family TonB-linked outer membrane protein [Hufsiella ginkgonis]|uniref:SusC/RagA family TonB-linked outer membrane protein n=1 Tax=Hufsiella ginkgonis TaxID=2695274 RepID=A0A7K1XYL8_9SPHI|nr:SusC/RagA family TonB-linked outer membrane protein [Hufsiella ginkgonis]MXV16091.1 SusC/RagA family TonB-linked outer membrane protein [Hufsiella ginkgonis]